MSAPHRTALLTQRDPLGPDGDTEVERAAVYYLYWSGKPLTDEGRVRASSQIRGLCGGRSVGRDELHVQLVVDELLEGLGRQISPSSTSGGGPALSFARRSSGQSSG